VVLVSEQVDAPLARVPTYTLPFAMAGTANFTAFPAVSALATALLQSKLATLVASCPSSSAGPPSLAVLEDI
jgi:hypothetical protein